MKSKERATKDSLVVPIAVSVLWLSIAIFVVALRITEFWQLSLNAIGDVLAGVFAPLAFFWLFVATTLQRRELRLQREELADTRKVLSEQREELERSVKESNNQTNIMQRTLETTQSRYLYEEFRLRLYYLAKYLNDYRAERVLATIPSGESANRDDLHHLFFWGSFEVSENDNTSVDEFFRRMQDRIGPKFSITSDVISKTERGYSLNNKLLFFLTRATSDLQKLLTEERYIDNSLVTDRIRSLDLELLLQRLQQLRLELSSTMYPTD